MPETGESHQAVDYEHTREHLATAVAELGMAQSVVRVVDAAFDYNEDGDPRPIGMIAKSAGESVEAVRTYLRIVLRRIGNESRVLDGLADPYPAALADRVVSGNGHASLEELPPRHVLVGGAKPVTAALEPVITADPAPRPNRRARGRRKDTGKPRVNLDDIEEPGKADLDGVQVPEDIDLDESDTGDDPTVAVRPAISSRGRTLPAGNEPGAGRRRTMGDKALDSSDLVRTYLNQIGKVALLNAEQEVELAKRIEAGVYAQHLIDNGQGGRRLVEGQIARDLRTVAREGVRARNDMLEANLRLVVSLAKRYNGRGLDLLDNIQNGSLGLIRAVDKFDYTKGYKFSTYATWWVRQSILRGLADQARTIRIPVHMVEDVNRVYRAIRTLNQKLAHDPTDEEVAKEVKLSPEKVAELRGYTREPLSLDQTVGENAESPLGDFIHVEDDMLTGEVSADYILLHEAVERVLATLGTARERGIIKMRYGLDDGEPHTLDEIGLAYGVTRERIRQIETKVMEKLRKPDNMRELVSFKDGIRD